MGTRKLDAATLRRIAVRASCTPRTIQKVYLGQPVRGLAYYRAAAALAEAGIESRAAAPTSRPVGAGDAD